ncbi:uncharacterized protein TRIADDRAFT_58822 [Trichoplax adhaerens]|uniref:R3H-associated N-terminal domain-containing protein n=1 Tax=Trichoplax adhaerens TaxID=10228 RepID=B3S3R9_TRIAD|nr:hypothetical protein TRIADDRAFT_58822 [Trichoplax adhaerens]EDV22517.1 hypothetical protein TRIADDRAFT_58822 [Trichoplax adhaerens]|eukprot:XP_002115061.1 hypothetical protein TRIADDRAFT_58822 [Trichoplax adhaerens]
MGQISKLEQENHEVDSDIECIEDLEAERQRKKDDKKKRKLFKKMNVPRLEITVKYMRKEKRKFKKLLKKNKSDTTPEDFPAFKPIDDFGDMDLSDLVPDFNSVFTLLLEKTENMKLWQDFINLPQEEQERILNKNKAKKKTNFKVKGKHNREPQDADMHLAKLRYNSIDPNIRKIIQTNDYIPWDLLKIVEEDVISPFSKDFDGILVMIMENRLLIHGLCQYHELKSISDNYNGVRHTVVEYTGENFTRFPVAFSSYLHEICAQN